MPEGLFVADLHSGYNPLVCRLPEPQEAKMRFETKPARSPSPEVAVQVDLLRLMLPEFTTIDGDSLKDTTATQSPEIRTALPLTDTFFEPPEIGEVKWASLPDVVAVGEKGRTREVSPIEYVSSEEARAPTRASDDVLKKAFLVMSQCAQPHY